MITTQEGVYIHAKGRNNKTTWEKFRKWQRWMLDAQVFPLRGPGGVRAGNEFSGMFSPEDAPKVLAKMKELGIK